MTDPLTNGNFDTFLFEYYTPINVDDIITGYCLNQMDCFAHGIIENLIHDYDYEQLTDIMHTPIRECVNTLVNSSAEDLMTVPDEYDDDVIEYFNQNAEGYYTLLYMCYFKLVDGMLRYIPYIMESASKQGIYYGDFRLTRNADFLILRMIRKSPYAQ